MTPEDRDYYASLSPMPIRMSERQWVEVFPEAKELFPGYIAAANAEIVKANDRKRQYIRDCAGWNERWLLELLLQKVEENIYAYTKKIKKWGFLLSSDRKKDDGSISDDDILRAKEVPIDTLYEGSLRKVGGRLVGRCPFHVEKSASFHIYVDQNSFWCYGCSTGGSVVDYVMKSQNCEFKKAIRILNNI